jgi:hypothetical protein
MGTLTAAKGLRPETPQAATVVPAKKRGRPRKAKATPLAVEPKKIRKTKGMG